MPDRYPPQSSRLLESYPTKAQADDGRKFWADLITHLKLSKLHGVVVYRVPGQSYWGCYTEPQE